MTRFWKIIASIAAVIGGILYFFRPKCGYENDVLSPFEQPKKELQGEKAELEKELDKLGQAGDTSKEDIEKKYNS